MLSSDTSNKTFYDRELLEYCGANFCSRVNLTNITGSIDSGSIIDEPPKDLIMLLTGILLGFALLASLTIAIFVDSNPKFVSKVNQSSAH